MVRTKDFFDQKIKIIGEGELGIRPSWDEYFMKMAIDASSRSSCRHVQAGTVIVKDNQTIATGYNGVPGRIKKNCLEVGCRKELKGLKYEESLDSGECYGVHAEMNALRHITRDIKEFTVYTTIFPCHKCAKELVAYEIESIIFKSIYSEKEMSKALRFFIESGVEVYKLSLSPERVYDIDFNRRKVFFAVWSPDEQKRIIRKLL